MTKLQFPQVQFVFTSPADLKITTYARSVLVINVAITAVIGFPRNSREMRRLPRAPRAAAVEAANRMFMHSTTDRSDAVENLIRSFPIRLVPHRELPERRTFYDRISLRPLALYDRLFSTPIFLAFARFISKQLLRQRLSSTPLLITFEGEQEPVSSGAAAFPAQFQRGVKRAIPALFSRLSYWGGGRLDSNSQQRKQTALLREIVAPDLLQELSAFHSKATDMGVSVSYTWNFVAPSWYNDSPFASLVSVRDVWHVFGTRRDVTGTLLRGLPVAKYHPTAVTRRLLGSEIGEVNSSKKPLHSFREAFVEFVYCPQEMDADDLHDDGSPTTDWKRMMVVRGAQRVAVDSKVFGGILEYRISRISDGSLMHAGFADLDSMAIRMESSHFVKEFGDTETWRIADVDNFLTTQRVVEEE
ncbi:hypothetical protein HDU83_004937 [Entophlyctis luteolus]|nr:hypothetical protein HDU82_009219 [Entophlyctis luteolus]KAJ3344704.1 hypothetical protein HDU83_004937 [Entophlyctis luteolus]